jgi:hypothetical protein
MIVGCTTLSKTWKPELKPVILMSNWVRLSMFSATKLELLLAISWSSRNSQLDFRLMALDRSLKLNKKTMFLSMTRNSKLTSKTTFLLDSLNLEKCFYSLPHATQSLSTKGLENTMLHLLMSLLWLMLLNNSDLSL